MTCFNLSIPQGKPHRAFVCFIEGFKTLNFDIISTKNYLISFTLFRKMNPALAIVLMKLLS